MFPAIFSVDFQGQGQRSNLQNNYTLAMTGMREVEFKTFYMVGILVGFYMSRIVRKPDFCLCENKGADQLRGNREADQRLCFRYTDSTFPLLLISEISSF